MSDFRPDFASRHIGPSSNELEQMLSVLGFQTLDQLIDRCTPKAIRSSHQLDLGAGLSENEFLQRAWDVAKKNKVLKSYIGLGYYNTHTPTVILRNILENPGWYTAYTPYQAEISQGRLEALLNFQTMIGDLTGLPNANASLLDEGTAAAEAINLAFQAQKKNPRRKVFIANDIFPQTLDVIRTRAEPVGIDVIVGDPLQFAIDDSFFAALVQYPAATGIIHDYRAWTKNVHDVGALVIAVADILSLTLITPPGEWGADICVGSTQRFGVSMGFGGPHAAYMSAKGEFQRMIPGRIIGVSKDVHGNPALRLALQTREQHIRREKATSNICTAQVLLAVMASMYAVYHGPKGLKNIAMKIHELTAILHRELKRLGFVLTDTNYFDTLCIDLKNSSEREKLLTHFRRHQMNLGTWDDKFVLISLDETTRLADVQEIVSVFAEHIGKPTKFNDQPEIPQLPKDLHRTSDYLTHPIFNRHHSETEMLRYIHSLEVKDLSLNHSMIPLGSCTMKLNATTEMIPVTWPELSNIHPFAPLDQAGGYLELITELERWMCEITGFAAISFQPNAGSQGEYAGLLIIRKYLNDKNESHRNICLIPSSAHGTNPASAVMAGFKVVVVACDEKGNIDLPDLKLKSEQHKNNLAALMVTYPSTHGVFEETIRDICDVIHKSGGQVYMDGANLNALVGLARPGEFGPDVMHINLHKTFCIPHGGGGPGMGPIGVAKHLVAYTPSHEVRPECGGKSGIRAVSAAPWGSASILPISWAYMAMMGASGLKKATQVAILNANYIANKLSKEFKVLYTGPGGLVAHECIVDMRPFKSTADVSVEDIAKRLMDYGFHSPTMSFPVPGTLMIEPTESESLSELDRFCDALLSIREEIREIESGKADKEDNVLKNSPHSLGQITADVWTHKYSREKAAYPKPWVRLHKFWTPVGRIDNVYGDRNLFCSCPPISDF